MNQKRLAEEIRDIEPEPPEDPDVDAALEAAETDPDELLGESEHALETAGKDRELSQPEVEEEVAREDESGTPVPADYDRLGRRLLHEATEDQ